MGVAILGPLAAGDEVSIGGVGYPDVKILGIDNGQVHFRLSNGNNLSRSVDQVTQIRVDSLPQYEGAVRLMAAGSWRNAIAAFEQVEKRTNLRWLQDWIRLQLLTCYDRAGQFSNAAETFVRVAQAFPRQAAKLAPGNIPTRGSTLNGEALATLGEALAAVQNHQAHEAIEQLYLAVLRKERPEEYARVAKSRPAAGTHGVAVRPPRGRLKRQIRRASALMRKKAFGDAVEVLNRLIPLVPYDQVWDLYLMRAEALLGQQDFLHAGLDFMKVAICQPDPRRRARGFHGAGVACERLGLGAKASMLRDKAAALGYKSSG